MFWSFKRPGKSMSPAGNRASPLDQRLSKEIQQLLLQLFV
jgi:hypothetical protein